MSVIDSNAAKDSISYREVVTGEYPKVKTFLDTVWKKNHIFSLNKELLDFQHQTSADQYTIVGAFNDNSDLLGILGFISPAFYSTRAINQGDDIWLAIWAADKKNSEHNGVGLGLLDFLNRTYIPNSVSAIGINKQVAMLYRLLGFEVGSLDQIYIPRKHYKKGYLGHNLRPSPCISELVDLEILPTSFEDIIDSNIPPRTAPPYKMTEWIRDRCQQHPCYCYQPLKIQYKRRSVAWIIAREVHAIGRTALRIVEMSNLTEDVPSFGDLLATFAEAKDYDYVDMVCDKDFGSELVNRGLLRANSESFPPHLFEPYDPKRVEVWYASNTSGLSISKLDSDLDRPNQRI